MGVGVGVRGGRWLVMAVVAVKLAVWNGWGQWGEEQGCCCTFPALFGNLRCATSLQLAPTAHNPRAQPTRTPLALTNLGCPGEGIVQTSE